jgi:phage tail sheath gpL-like
MLYAVPPIDGDVGDIIDYNFRDVLVKNGCSTTNFKNNSYYAADVLTTYKPDGETDPIFKFVRDNMIIFNIIDQLKKFNARQKNKSIAPNALPSIHITSPALYKAGVLNEIVKPFVELGYIADFEYAKDNLDVGINPSNAGRFDVVTPELITSLLRIIAVDVQVNKYNG